MGLLHLFPLAELLADEERLVGRDAIDTEIDHILDVLLLVDGPAVDAHLVVAGLLEPCRVLSEDLVLVVNTVDSELGEFLRALVLVQVLNRESRAEGGEPLAHIQTE